MSWQQLSFDHSFAGLATYGQPNPFYVAMDAEAVAKTPKLLAYNAKVAKKIGLSQEAPYDPAFLEIFTGNQPMLGGKPLASAYSGHQFGQWAGQLGDGRALLIAQARDAQQGLWDIQLKGSGLTPFSRMGDGRAVVRSSVREYLASIALDGLGIPTTHALCLIGTGAPVQRERLEQGAVLTRVAQSHLRFGHFEHFAHHGMHDHLKTIYQHLIDEYFVGLSPMAYFAEITQRTAHLIADWQAYGFAHGVMNTDNMSALGLTIDYGPYGFLDTFDLGHICNHSDAGGRYRFDRQPEIAQWNLWALAHALDTILPMAQSQEILQDFLPTFMTRYHQNMMRRLGLSAQDASPKFWQQYLVVLQKSSADYTLSFWEVYDGLEQQTPTGGLFVLKEGQDWWQEYRAIIEKGVGITQARETMQQANPRYILRNWLAENAIRAIEDRDDTAPLDRLAHVLENPFIEHVNCADLQQPPPANMRGLAVSCSS